MRRTSSSRSAHRLDDRRRGARRPARTSRRPGVELDADVEHHRRAALPRLVVVADDRRCRPAPSTASAPCGRRRPVGSRGASRTPRCARGQGAEVVHARIGLVARRAAGAARAVRPAGQHDHVDRRRRRHAPGRAQPERVGGTADMSGPTVTMPRRCDGQAVAATMRVWPTPSGASRSAGSLPVADRDRSSDSTGDWRGAAVADAQLDPARLADRDATAGGRRGRPRGGGGSSRTDDRGQQRQRDRRTAGDEELREPDEPADHERRSRRAPPSSTPHPRQLHGQMPASVTATGDLAWGPASSASDLATARRAESMPWICASGLTISRWASTARGERLHVVGGGVAAALAGGAHPDRPLQAEHGPGRHAEREVRGAGGSRRRGRAGSR